MSIILSLIEERNNQLLNFGAKKEERENLVKQLAILDNEISNFDENKTLREVDELTDCAVKLGLIAPPEITPEEGA